MNDLLKVLLIEDNPGDISLIREMLREVECAPFELGVANRLSTGVEQAVGNGFNAILLDLSLPDSDGLDTLEALRDRSELPIIVLTGSDDEAMALSAVRAGAQDYLIKGKVSVDALHRSVRYAIERKRAEKRITRLSSLYAALSQTNQTIIRVTEPRKLLDRVCEIAVRSGGFRHAGISFADVPGGPLRLAAAAHREGTFAESLRLVAEQIDFDRADPGASPSADGHELVFNDLATCATAAAWRSICMAFARPPCS